MYWVFFPSPIVLTCRIRNSRTARYIVTYAKIPFVKSCNLLPIHNHQDKWYPPSTTVSKFFLMTTSFFLDFSCFFFTSCSGLAVPLHSLSLSQQYTPSSLCLQFLLHSTAVFCFSMCGACTTCHLLVIKTSTLVSPLV